MHLQRTHIATGGTLAALGVLAAVALGARGDSAPSETAAAPAPQVRTEVIRRTVRVRPRNSGPAATAPRGASAAPAPPAATPPAAPVASHRHDDGHEGEDDHHGRGRGRGRGGDEGGRGRGRGGDDGEHGGDDD